MGKNDLAVIMAVYQNDKLYFLKKAIQSICNQTYNQFTLFIALNGPFSHEIDDYLSSLKDDRIRQYRLEKNIGLARALNFLLDNILKESCYEFIARMDADDISIPLRFEKQYNFLKSNPDISCVGSWYQEIDEDGSVLSYRELPCEHIEIRKFFFKRSPFAHPAVMFRKRLIEIAGLYPINTLRLEDYALWGNVLICGLKLANIPEYMLQFRLDRNFYNRRSGLRYGTNYIVTHFSIFNRLKAPFYAYLFSLIVGIGRMMPPFVIKFLYRIFRKRYT